ncbi:chorismate synthase [Candidatus Gracilibacteria bacterium]|nr:chorismate synthase [Candidatus Gracilibacteria bacterium]
MMNTFGNLFRVTSFGESHGPMVGCVIDGCPPNLELSEKNIQKYLDKRCPGKSKITSERKEKDICEIVSGVFEGRTTGTPIAVLVRNHDARSQDYEKLKDVFRPSHADATYQLKYGIRDYRGGGRSSGRETIARVIGGAVAQQILKSTKTKIIGFAREIGGTFFENVDFNFIEENPLRMADKKEFEKIFSQLQKIKTEKNSLGGVVEIRVINPPAGLGSPVFGKLEADLASACLSVGSVKGFEIGEGFTLSRMKGSEANDSLVSFLNPGLKISQSRVQTLRNANGGILGGISTGEDIWFRVAIKPTSSIGQKQKTIDSKGNEIELEIEGRHDSIIVPRVIPILEAMTALVLVDQLFLHRAQIGK